MHVQDDNVAEECAVHAMALQNLNLELVRCEHHRVFNQYLAVNNNIYHIIMIIQILNKQAVLWKRWVAYCKKNLLVYHWFVSVKTAFKPIYCSHMLCVSVPMYTVLNTIYVSIQVSLFYTTSQHNSSWNCEPCSQCLSSRSCESIFICICNVYLYVVVVPLNQTPEKSVREDDGQLVNFGNPGDVVILAL